MQSNGVLTAVQWIEGLLLGPIATVVATIAIAAVGFLMLNGSVNWKRGATVILGCFLIFGAPLISAGLLGSFSGTATSARPIVAEPIVIAPPPPKAEPYDPYAGAAIRPSW